MPQSAKAKPASIAFATGRSPIRRANAPAAAPEAWYAQPQAAPASASGTSHASSRGPTLAAEKRGSPPPAADQLGKPEERTEGAHHGAQVHCRLAGTRQLDVHLAFRHAPVGRARKRRGEAVERGGEQGRQRCLRAGHGHGAEVGAEAAHAVAHPCAQTGDHACQARLGAHAAAEQQRQQRRERTLAKVVVRIAPLAFHLAHDHVQLLGGEADMLVVQPDGKAADQAHDQRPCGEPERPRCQRRNLLARRRPERLRQLLPQKPQADVHAEKERPHERAGDGARDQHAQREQQSVRRLGKLAHENPLASSCAPGARSIADMSAIL